MSGKTYSFDNFNIDVNGETMYVIVWGITLGVIFGLLMSLLCRIGANSLISALVKSGARDESSALTLDQLNPKHKTIVKRLLRKTDSSIRRVVLCSNESEFADAKVGRLKKLFYEKFLGDSVPVKTPFGEAKFYLPEENRIGAELRYSLDRHPVMTFVMGSVGLLIVAAFVTFAIPELLTMFDNFITQIKG